MINTMRKETYENLRKALAIILVIMTLTWVVNLLIIIFDGEQTIISDEPDSTWLIFLQPFFTSAIVPILFLMNKPKEEEELN
ncbi:MAG: hypothetical protein GY870_01750 [archaeon]|nr:hypothetical protein [archaeon]